MMAAALLGFAGAHEERLRREIFLLARGALSDGREPADSEDAVDYEEPGRARTPPRAFLGALLDPGLVLRVVRRELDDRDHCLGTCRRYCQVPAHVVMAL